MMRAMKSELAKGDDDNSSEIMLRRCLQRSLHQHVASLYRRSHCCHSTMPIPNSTKSMVVDCKEIKTSRTSWK
ncbi:hypothetical protein PV325_012230 [Microctonus aethiopoides]|nr:hypothetical protein PV325_012230 [Microctonus aethiopoides]KAK0072827.1 hypothetical protein PV326_014079 [Microctonus aethiopoides]